MGQFDFKYSLCIMLSHSSNGVYQHWYLLINCSRLTEILTGKWNLHQDLRVPANTKMQVCVTELSTGGIIQGRTYAESPKH